MGIVFFCQSCGARFEVDPRMAGKKGRCKKCGQAMTIPRAEEIASMVAMPALAAAAVGAGVSSVAGVDDGGKSIGAWLKGGLSQVGLAPLTVQRMPLRPSKPSPLDDAEDSKPYVLANPLVENRGRARVQDNIVVRLWRRELGGIQKIFRKINQAAYLISVPFIMILILGALAQSRSLAMLGATAVVLLNIGRLVSGAANLAIVPFRDGIKWSRMKKPFWRVVEPAITIVLVFLAFIFIPWLSGGKPVKGGLGARIRAGAEVLQEDIEGQVKQVSDKSKRLDLEKLGNQAREKLQGLGSPSGASPAKEESTNPPGFRGAIKALERRTQEELEKAKALNEPRQQP